MKKVFATNAECIHVFAQRTQYEGRSSGGNVFFEGDKLYSYGYHFCLAEFRDNGRYVILNREYYSQSTSQHQSLTGSALSHVKSFRSSETKLHEVYEAILGWAEMLTRARNPVKYLDLINGMWSRYNEYLDFAKIKGVKNKGQYRKLRNAVKRLNEDLAQTIVEYKAKMKAQAEAKAKAEAKKLAETIERFRNHETDYVYEGKFAYLRLSKDGKNVETSKGVRIAVEDARKLYWLIQRGRDIKGYKLDHYTVISINGTLKVGCHEIPRDDVSDIGEMILPDTYRTPNDEAYSGSSEE